MDARTSKWKIHSCESKKYYICKMTLDVCLCPPPCRNTTTTVTTTTTTSPTASPALQTSTQPLSNTTSPRPTCRPCASSSGPGYTTLQTKLNTTAVPLTIWAPEICKMSINQSTSCASDDPTCSCLLGVLANPNGSIRAAFNDGLGVNRSVVIRGQANSTAERLIVKLLLGKEDNVTALQLNFHFGNKSIVLNSQADKNTAQQTVNVSQAHQFGPGLNFKIVIQCGNKTFNMNLDDNVQLGLEHQLRNLQRIKWLEVWHVLLSSVQLM
ncbi:galectin-4-like isoform X3 [Syngnathus scovelli]|nr:uncharacterized protein LOC125971884 isoform X3 [Syngnathus scovelli]